MFTDDELSSLINVRRDENHGIYLFLKPPIWIDRENRVDV